MLVGTSSRLLLYVRVCVCVCVCVCEKEIEREREIEGGWVCVQMIGINPFLHSHLLVGNDR